MAGFLPQLVLVPSPVRRVVCVAIAVMPATASAARTFAGALSGSGGKWQISTRSGSEPMWRGDGKELFYLNGNKLIPVQVNGSEPFRQRLPHQVSALL